MTDNGLRDDMIKLVRYQIILLKPDDECLLAGQEELVGDNIDEATYTGIKIAEFIGSDKGKKYKDDLKYLRVHHEVVARYPKEPFKFEEQQIKVLKEISQKIS